MEKQTRPFRLGVAILGSVLAAGGLRAQEPMSRDTIEAIPLAPVTVTVLRAPFSMAEVPYSVSVKTREEIQRGKPGLSVEEALRVIPGVQVENRFNYALGERITIRGFGGRAQFGVKGIRVVVDGIPATLPDGQSSLTHVDVKTLGRVEVIRGPAASLYGNTAGGVIQMETQQPPPFPVSQEFGVVAGSHDLLRMSSSTGGRSGAASYRVNLSRLEFGGYRTRCDPGPPSTCRAHDQARNLYLSGRFGIESGRDRVRVTVGAGDSDAMNPGSLSAEMQETDRFQVFQQNVNRLTGKTVREGTLGASWFRTGGPGLMEFSAYLASRDVRNPIPSDIIEFSRTGGGLRALLSSEPAGAFGLRWALGAEADRQRDDRQNYGYAGPTSSEPGALRLDQLERVNNVGLFGQLAATPVSRLTLMTGLRFDWFGFDVQDRFLADNTDDSGSRTMDAFSPSVGATYAIHDRLHLYGNLGTTFETPTTTELANRPEGAGGFNPELEPQRAVSYELGTRYRLGSWLAAQLAVYRADVENSLIPFEVPQAPARRFYRNAGSATHQGVELGLTLAPLSGLTLHSAYSHTDARFDDYTVGTQSFAGNQIPGVAPHRIDATLTVAPRRAAWYGAVESRYVSRLAVNDANTAFSPAYNVVELRGGVEAWRIGAVTIDPFAGISNLLDVEYNAAVTVNAFGGRFFESGPGRSFYVGGNARFDRR
jgi:iron complex outermembrane recepter protein